MKVYDGKSKKVAEVPAEWEEMIKERLKEIEEQTGEKPILMRYVGEFAEITTEHYKYLYEEKDGAYHYIGRSKWRL